jgi:hypothetical protein
MPTTSGVPRPNIRAGARRPQPISTRFELVPHQGGVTRRFLAYSSPSRSPNPNHLAVLARPGFVRAAPALPGTTRIRLPSAPPSCCDRISDVGLSPPFESLHFTAHARRPAHLRHAHAPGAQRAGGNHFSVARARRHCVHYAHLRAQPTGEASPRGREHLVVDEAKEVRTVGRPWPACADRVGPPASPRKHARR